MVVMRSSVQPQHAPAPPAAASHADTKLDASPTASTAAESSTMDEKKEGPMADTAPYVPQHFTAQLQQQHHYYHATAYAPLPHHPMAHPMMPAAAGGGAEVPPQQVYVNTVVQQQQQQQQQQLRGGGAGLGTLETQFQSLTFNSHQQHAKTSSSSGHPPDDSVTEDLEGGEEEEEEEEHTDGEEPVKLFVGQVPKTMNEEDIFPAFDTFGPLKDVTIIRDKHTQLHRGCAFVTFWSGADAELAQEALHGKHTFPGARRPAQVKPAEPSVPENKLFVGMLSRKAGEEDVQQLFGPFGEIREIYMIRSMDGSSKCAAFLRFVHQESAIQAIESLHNNFVMEGSSRPLIVKFADNKHQRQQRHIRNVRRHEVMNISPYHGYHPQHMAMTATPGGPPQAYPPHMAGPLPHHQYGAHYPGLGGGPHAHHPYHPHHMYPSPHHDHHQYGAPPHAAYGAATPYNQHDGSGVAARGVTISTADGTAPPNPRPREGPAGANLFVYHLPHDLTDADLATAFNPFGNVISAKVYVDKFSAESKGFGFVSYDSVISAESAIEQMNGFQIGNKRLKVQHKRVHGHNGGGGPPPSYHGPPPAAQHYDPSGTIPGAVPAHATHVPVGLTTGHGDEALATPSHSDAAPSSAVAAAP